MLRSRGPCGLDETHKVHTHVVRSTPSEPASTRMAVLWRRTLWSWSSKARMHAMSAGCVQLLVFRRNETGDGSAVETRRT